MSLRSKLCVLISSRGYDSSCCGFFNVIFVKATNSFELISAELIFDVFDVKGTSNPQFSIVSMIVDFNISLESKETVASLSSKLTVIFEIPGNKETALVIDFTQD